LVDAEVESATEGELDAGVRLHGRHDVSSSGAATSSTATA
jgi:hypothetical protein